MRESDEDSDNYDRIMNQEIHIEQEETVDSQEKGL